MTELSPSLVQIKTETDVVKKLKGIKLNANVSLGNFKEYGEVLFTEYGLSGPCGVLTFVTAEKSKDDFA